MKDNYFRFKTRIQYGYTLIELLITLSIMGIILGAAVISYGQYLISANRQDAVSLLSTTVLRLERCFTLEGTYNGACTLRAISEDGLYTLEAARQAQSYTLSAVPVAAGRQAKDSDCATLTISSTGDKTATGPKGRNCW